MGMWGIAPFDNDTAADWFADTLPLAGLPDAMILTLRDTETSPACRDTVRWLFEALGHAYVFPLDEHDTVFDLLTPDGTPQPIWRAEEFNGTWRGNDAETTPVLDQALSAMAKYAVDTLDDPHATWEDLRAAAWLVQIIARPGLWPDSAPPIRDAVASAVSGMQEVHRVWVDHHDPRQVEDEPLIDLLAGEVRSLWDHPDNLWVKVVETPEDAFVYFLAGFTPGELVTAHANGEMPSVDAAKILRGLLPHN